MNALAQDLRRALDPVALAEQIGMNPDPWQTEVLRSDAKRILLLCSRQSGKSTTAALLSLWTALYEPGSLVLLAAVSQDQARELFRTALTAYRTLGRPVGAEAEKQLELELENGSRILVLAGRPDTTRGKAKASLIVIDEAAHVPDEYYQALRPMLAVSDGRLIAMSTPYGRRGWFYETWNDAGPAGRRWTRWKIPAHECPRIRPEFLEEERLAMGEWMYSQEYECVFQDMAAQVFRTDDIERLVDPELEHWELL